MRSRVHDVACEWRTNDPTYGDGCTKGGRLHDCPRAPAADGSEAPAHPPADSSAVRWPPPVPPRPSPPVPSQWSPPAPRRLLTVHLVTAQVADEYRRHLPDFERQHYSRQSNASVLVATPSRGRDVVYDVPSALGLLPRPESPGSRHGRFLIPQSATELFVEPVEIELPRTMPSSFAERRVNATCNLVTNRTWEHFWMNEGFTVYLERSILAALYGETMFHFHALGPHSPPPTPANFRGGGVRKTSVWWKK